MEEYIMVIQVTKEQNARIACSDKRNRNGRKIGENYSSRKKTKTIKRRLE